jgi:DNA uptake protein ComE-like DNA-binding protein
MASTLQKAQRRAAAMERLADALGVDLSVHAKGDIELMHILQLERIADALPDRGSTNSLYAAIEAAGEEELTTIPGIGPATAKRIKEEMAKATAPEPAEPEPAAETPA